MIRCRATWKFCATIRCSLIAVWGTVAGMGTCVSAEDVSAPAILQMYEARWDTIENRMADIFQVGYGRMWVPPPNRAGSGFSVGYDVFDRFELGKPREETHYGTATSFKAFVAAAHDAGVLVNPDLIWNHSGVGNRTDANFVALGGYPGFALTLPGAPHNDIDGDYHNPFLDALLDDQILGQLAGLNDIAQEKNHQFIRHPIEEGNPNNIPAGTLFNRPDPNNARFYPDQDLGGTTVFHPQLGTNVTLYDFNGADPLAGDPVMENATGLLMRNARWMIQEFDVDGFRLDAARHYPRWVLDYFDQASFLAKQTPLLDGSPRHVFSFIETGGDSPGFIQDFICKDIDNGNLGQVGGNRDVLDFNLFYALRDRLTSNGAINNWHDIVGASIDRNDAVDKVNRNNEWNDGSQGVAFVQSHDETGPFLSNVAHAYILMRPGNALVYLNAEQYGPTGSFPQPGKVDALGGFYGDTIAKLVEIRNSHGRGDFQERWIDFAGGFSNVYIYERANSAIVGLNSRNDDVIETRTGVQTSFATGTILVELTGNAADAAVDPGGMIPDTLRVNSSGQVDVSIPANNPHGRGYVIYGLATPQGSLSLTNVATTLGGATPTAATNGTARLADVTVIHADSFDVQLSTSPVSLPDPDNPGIFVRDFDADGDQAQIKIDRGTDLNNSGSVDHTTPGDVSYGFEEFTDTRIPGYIDDGGGGNIGTGAGQYVQTIDATQLAEGRHYVTVRAFRHRDSGPAIFKDFKRTIYVDRLPPEAAVESFEPFASSPGDPDDRDLIVRSVDQTADNMHTFLDLPAGLSDAEVLAMALGGQNDAGEYDRDQWIYGFFGVTTGNHVATVVSFEPTFNGTNGYNVQRFPGLFTATNLGAGLGDLDADGQFEVADLSGPGGFEDVLYSQNDQFNAAADVTADGLVDNRDLFALGAELISAGAAGGVLTEYEDTLLRRADLDASGQTNAADLALLYNNLGLGSWLFDIDVDGTVDAADAEALIRQLARTVPGDYNLDGSVNAADYTMWRDRVGQSGGGLIADGDFDGDVDEHDYVVWSNAFGFERGPFMAGSAAASAAALPEPATIALTLIVGFTLARRSRYGPPGSGNDAPV